MYVYDVDFDAALLLYHLQIIKGSMLCSVLSIQQCHFSSRVNIFFYTKSTHWEHPLCKVEITLQVWCSNLSSILLIPCLFVTLHAILALSSFLTLNQTFFLQELVEALPCSQPVPISTRIPSLHVLHDLPVLPHGFLASYHHLLQHPYIITGRHIAYILIHTH